MAEIPRSKGGGPGALVSIDFEPNAAAINIGLEKWSKLIKDWRPIWTDVVRLFHRHEQRHFDSEGQSTGPKFADLSELYREWKDENAPFAGLPILQFSGTLRASLVARGPGSLIKIGKRAMTIGINPGYSYPETGASLGVVAAAHSTGIPGRLHIRPPIRLDPTITGKTSPMAFGAVVAQIAQRHIVEARKKAYLGAKDPFVTMGDRSLLAGDLTRKPTK